MADAYKNQTEVVALAQKFKDKGLSGSIGVIVCDLPEPTESPYYRLDPKRFPNVKAMAAQVKQLTGGATLMPNIKPTGVASKDCPACGTQVCPTTQLLIRPIISSGHLPAYTESFSVAIPAKLCSTRLNQQLSPAC